MNTTSPGPTVDRRTASGASAEAPFRSGPLVLWPTLSVSLMAFLWMGRALVTGEIPFTGDLLHWNYPIRDFFSTALRSGHRVWWMPSLFGGFDVAGEGQLGVFHPLHWMLYGVLPLDRAFAVELIAPYAALFAGTWVFLRRVCADAFAAAGAMLVAFSGFALAHGVHMNMMAVLAHVPWLLWACDRQPAARDLRTRARLAAGIALLAGSQVLFGHPQAFWWSALLVATYLVFRALGPDRWPISSLWPAVVGLALGVGIGAVQVLSTLYEVRHSTRPVDDAAFATSFSLAPRGLWQLVAPYVLWGRVLRWNESPGAGDEFAVYAGAVTLALAAWWAAGWPARRHRTTALDRLAAWGLAVAALGLWLALGRYGGLYYLQTWLPIVGEFRAPVRYVWFTHTGLAIVATAALVRLSGARHTGSVSAGWAPWALVVISAAGAWWLTASGADRPSTAALLAGPVLFTAAALAIGWAARGARVAIAALVLLAAADHLTYGLGGVVAWHDFVTRAQAEAYLRDRPDGMAPSDGRIARGGYPNLYALGGFRLIDGYAGLTPRKALDYRSRNALQVAGVSFAHESFLDGHAVSGAEPAGGRWFKLPAPLPRVRLVADVRITANPGVDIDRIDVTRTALVSTDPGLPPPPGKPVDGTAALTRDEPGALSVAVSTPVPQLLVVAESFDEGWAATVDGAARAVEQVNGDFLGVIVPSGRHAVALTFSPPGYRLGLAISLSSLVLVAVCGIGRRAS